MRVKERGEPSIIRNSQLAFPLLSCQNLLNHEGIDVDETDLKQVQRKHGNFLVIQAIGGNFTASTIENKTIGRIPVLDCV
jgi:hypothetical protein